MPNAAEFKIAYDTLHAKRIALEEEAKKLDANASNLSDADKQRRVQIVEELQTITVEEHKLTVPDITKASSVLDSVSIAEAKKALITRISPLVEAPPKGTLVVAHPTADPNNLVEYMTLTQYLNPYGRKRQCDTDLENLMLIVDKSLAAQIKQNREIQKKLQDLHKQ